MLEVALSPAPHNLPRVLNRNAVAESAPSPSAGVLNCAIAGSLHQTPYSVGLLILMARPKRFEPPTPRFVAWCHGQPVAIEPGLQRQSPENGNFPPGGRRLSANLRLRPRNRKRGDRPPECKSPPLAGLSLSRLVSSTVALPGCRSGVRSSGLEIAAATGLSCQQVQPENTELRPSWRREGDSSSWHGRAAVVIKPVSADSLRKTGIFADKAGDFRPFPPQDR